MKITKLNSTLVTDNTEEFEINSTKIIQLRSRILINAASNKLSLEYSRYRRLLFEKGLSKDLRNKQSEERDRQMGRYDNIQLSDAEIEIRAESERIVESFINPGEKPLKNVDIPVKKRKVRKGELSATPDLESSKRLRVGPSPLTIPRHPVSILLSGESKSYKHSVFQKSVAFKLDEDDENLHKARKRVVSPPPAITQEPTESSNPPPPIPCSHSKLEQPPPPPPPFEPPTDDTNSAQQEVNMFYQSILSGDQSSSTYYSEQTEEQPPLPPPASPPPLSPASSSSSPPPPPPPPPPPVEGPGIRSSQPSRNYSSNSIYSAPSDESDSDDDIFGSIAHRNDDDDNRNFIY